jgi:hypothetical protein
VLVEVAADTFSLLIREGNVNWAAKRQKKAEIDANANSIYLAVVVHSHLMFKSVLNENLGGMQY